MVDPRLCCGSCFNCKSLNTNGCAKWGFLGLSGCGGGLSETVAVDASMCHVLPESVPLELAALIEPLSVAHHATVCAGVEDWSTMSVLCVGGGPVGVAIIIILRARRVGQVLVSEPTAKRQQYAAEIADAVINPAKESVGEWCRSLTNGKRTDVAFDCASVQAGLDAGMDALGFGGIYVNVAGWENPRELPNLCFVRKLTIDVVAVPYATNSTHAQGDYRQRVFVLYTRRLSRGHRRFQRRYKISGVTTSSSLLTCSALSLSHTGKFGGLSQMVTSQIALEDVLEKGFEELIAHKDDHIKILVTPRHIRTYNPEGARTRP